MPTLIKRGRKKGEENGSAAPMPEAATPETATQEPATEVPPPAQATQMAVERQPPASTYRPPAEYTPPDGAEDFQLPERHVPAEPPPSREPPAAKGGLLNRVLLFTGEQTPAERDRIAAEEFEQAIAPVIEYMRAAVPEASTPEEAARILSENQGEVTPDPQGGSYVPGDAFDKDARVYYRLLRRDYEKNPRPSEKRAVSPHLHGVYGKLTGTKGW